MPQYLVTGGAGFIGSQVRIAYTDLSHARTVLGAWPETSLADGIARTAGWARNHGPVDLASIVRIEVPHGNGAEWVGWVSNRLNGENDARRALAEGAA